MALASSRQKSEVDPANGVYVEMEGVMEVRYLSEDIDYQKPAEDMWHFQKRVRHIPDDFCHKNKQTTEQNIFFCLVCNCDLKNLRPLKDHVSGNKHIRKACDYKRQILGLPKEPQNAPRKKEIKTERPRVDVSMRLEELLEDSGSPAIGLEYITEFINPRNPRDHPMYTCSLAGCKSAWGTSDDIFHHVQNSKHQKNFFKKLHPEDPRVAGLTKDTLLLKARDYEEELGGPLERDYGQIIVVDDLERYLELRERPDDWSEKKAQLGFVGSRSNSNNEPLGKRPAGKRRKSSQSDSVLDEFDWRDWEPPTKRSAVRDLVENFTLGVGDVRDMVESFKGRKGDEDHENILFYLKTYEDQLSLHAHDESVAEVDRDFPSKASSWSNQLSELRETLEEKTEGEDKAVKEISKLMAELEDEVKCYYSARTTTKYQNIQARMKTVTNKMSQLKPSCSHNLRLMDNIKARLAQLWIDFEDRSESVVDLLTRQMDVDVGSSREKKEDILKNEAIQRYEKEMIGVVSVYLRTYRDKFPDNRALSKYAVETVKNKILPQEITQYSKTIERTKKSWSDFHVTEVRLLCL